jgi:hypothetical protein
LQPKTQLRTAVSRDTEAGKGALSFCQTAMSTNVLLSSSLFRRVYLPLPFANRNTTQKRLYSTRNFVSRLVPLAPLIRLLPDEAHFIPSDSEFKYRFLLIAQIRCCLHNPNKLFIRSNVAWLCWQTSKKHSLFFFLSIALAKHLGQSRFVPLQSLAFVNCIKIAHSLRGPSFVQILSNQFRSLRRCRQIVFIFCLFFDLCFACLHLPLVRPWIELYFSNCEPIASSGYKKKEELEDEDDSSVLL